MKSLRRLLPFLGPYAKQLALGLACVVASSALASGSPWLLRGAVDGIRAGLPAGRIWPYAAGMVGLAVAAGALRYVMRELLNGVSRRVETDLRDALFTHLETLDAPFFAQNRTGDLMARLTNDLGAVRMAAGPAIMYLVNTIAGGLFALGFMLRIDPMLTGIALLPMLPMPVVMVRMGRTIHDRFEAVQEHFGDMTTQVQENLSGARVVRAYRQEAAEVERFARANDEYRALNMRLARLYGIMHPLFGLMAGLGAVAVLGVGGTLAVRGTISVGSLVAFGFYLGMLTWPLIALGWVINLFQRGEASAGRLMEVLDARPRVADPRPERVRHLPPAAGGRSLELRGVWFLYPAPEGEAPRPVLRGVSLHVPAGGTLAVVGATGSGKSALLDLIPRLHDPTEGEVLLDGVPIRDVPLAELRRELGVVSQESVLFSETIAENISYGLPDREADGRGTTGPADGPSAHSPGSGALDTTPGLGGAADPVRWSAGVAQLDESVRAFPGGYETVLGERGINLSGGQKQRAALARALARRPSVVLLDDALSAVDTHTEAAILHSLRDALAGRPAVIASHRISAIRDATWIVVLDEGRIVEQGRHEDLMALGGRYWSLLRRQQLEEEVEEEGEAVAR